MLLSEGSRETDDISRAIDVDAGDRIYDIEPMLRLDIMEMRDFIVHRSEGVNETELGNSRYDGDILRDIGGSGCGRGDEIKEEGGVRDLRGKGLDCGSFVVEIGRVDGESEREMWDC